jgi:uncharacterized protein
MEQKIPFIGRGWSFPPAFNKAAKAVELLEDERDIESSLEILFTTRLGERIMQPTYGCDLQDLVFESLTLTQKTYLRDLIETAILYHEPRIRLDGVVLDTSQEMEGLLLIILDYTIRTTNTRFNFVFPFFKTEATNLLIAR